MKYLVFILFAMKDKSRYIYKSLLSFLFAFSIPSKLFLIWYITVHRLQSDYSEFVWPSLLPWKTCNGVNDNGDCISAQSFWWYIHVYVSSRKCSGKIKLYLKESAISLVTCQRHLCHREHEVEACTPVGPSSKEWHKTHFDRRRWREETVSDRETQNIGIKWNKSIFFLKYRMLLVEQQKIKEVLGYMNKHGVVACHTWHVFTVASRSGTENSITYWCGLRWGRRETVERHHVLMWPEMRQEGDSGAWTPSTWRGAYDSWLWDGAYTQRVEFPVFQYLRIVNCLYNRSKSDDQICILRVVS